MGADAALLIAAVLPNTDMAYLLKSAAKLGLQVIIEVHTIAGASQLHLMRTCCLPTAGRHGTVTAMPCSRLSAALGRPRQIFPSNL